MSKENIYEGISHIIEFNLEEKPPCKECDKNFNSLDSAVNHYISTHKYRLLNIGTQSSLHSNGDLVHDIIAHLGK